ncbi:MAG TPA: DUF4173 domain-containing protein [Gemmatimonadaceae bacterium]|nr:DUF4173 domain-containing protein [Gemmatimonadaceae bacterium]
MTMPASAAPAAAVSPIPGESPGPLGVAALARHAATIWPPAVVVAGLGTWLCFDASPGLNWALWTVAAALGLAWVVRRTRGRVGLPLGVVLAAACALAACMAITADGAFAPIVLLGVAVLLALGMTLAEGTAPASVGAVSIVATPVVGALRTIREAVRRSGELARLARAGRNLSPVARGVVLALPVVCVLALLLSAADPVLAHLRDDVLALGGITFPVQRAIFFGMLGTLTVGAYGIAVRGTPDPATATPEGRLVLGETERFVVLASVGGLFALFLGLQLSYFFGNAPAIAGSGLTYAEYAHRGFGELSVAATVATMLVVWLDHHAERGQGEPRTRVAGLVLIFLVQLLLDSAYRRVSLYEAAYGYTAARLYARVYMIGVSLALAALGIEIWSQIDVRRLVRRVSLLGVGSVIALSCWNHEAWIAQRNIDRFTTTGRIDEAYLVHRLSPNAVPTIIRALPRLPEAESSKLATMLAATYTGRHSLGDSHWYEWNLRAAQAREALATIGIGARGPSTGGNTLRREP